MGWGWFGGVRSPFVRFDCGFTFPWLWVPNPNRCISHLPEAYSFSPKPAIAPRPSIRISATLMNIILPRRPTSPTAGPACSLEPQSLGHPGPPRLRLPTMIPSRAARPCPPARHRRISRVACMPQIHPSLTPFHCLPQSWPRKPSLSFRHDGNDIKCTARLCQEFQLQYTLYDNFFLTEAHREVIARGSCTLATCLTSPCAMLQSIIQEMQKKPPLFCGFEGASLQVGLCVGWARTGTWRAELSILPPAGPGGRRGAEMRLAGLDAT